MVKERIPAAYSGTPWQGVVTVYTQQNNSYIWDVDNKRFTIPDIHNVTEEQLQNPFYREALVSAAIDNSIVVIPYTAPPLEPNRYRIWDLVPTEQIPGGNKSTVPYGINYGGVDLIHRIHPKVWMHHGLVVQTIYYKEFFPTGSSYTDTESNILLDDAVIDGYYGATIVGPDVVLDTNNRATYLDTVQTLDIPQVYMVDTYKTPLVREQWYWVLDPATNLVISRDIHIEWYRGEDDLTDPDNPIPTILPPMKNYEKFYPITANKIHEIQRRRFNVVRSLEDHVITFIVMTQTLPDIVVDPNAPTEDELDIAKVNAIVLGQAYMSTVSNEVRNFQEYGIDDLAVVTESVEIRTAHSFLDNTLEVVGMPGVSIYQYVAAEIRIDISDEMDIFDYSTLPLQ